MAQGRKKWLDKAKAVENTGKEEKVGAGLFSVKKV